MILQNEMQYVEALERARDGQLSLNDAMDAADIIEGSNTTAEVIGFYRTFLNCADYHPELSDIYCRLGKFLHNNNLHALAEQERDVEVSGQDLAIEESVVEEEVCYFLSSYIHDI